MTGETRSDEDRRVQERNADALAGRAVSDEAELRYLIDLLERAYRTARDDIRRTMPHLADPNEARDPAGRYLLLDALTQLATARAALAMLVEAALGVGGTT